MKKRKFWSMMLVVLLTSFMVSCGDDEDKNGNNSNNADIAITGSCIEVGENYARIEGFFNQNNVTTYKSSLQIGVECADNDSFKNSKFVQSKVIEGNKFEVVVNNLKEATVYYYRTCIKVDALNYVGKTSTFTTNEKSQNDDNNKDDIDKDWEDWLKDVQTEIKASYGSYEGYLYTMSNESTKEVIKKDSIFATWTLNNDSTIDLHDVPAALIVKHLPDSQKELKEAVSNAGNVKIHVQLVYDYYYHSPLMMYAYPQTLTFPIIYQGETHKVEVQFYNYEEAAGTYAQYMMKDGDTYVHKNIIYLFPKTLYMDNKLQAQFTSASFLIWKGCKK